MPYRVTSAHRPGPSPPQAASAVTSSVIKGYADKLVGAIADLETAYKSAADKVTHYHSCYTFLGAEQVARPWLKRVGRVGWRLVILSLHSRQCRTRFSSSALSALCLLALIHRLRLPSCPSCTIAQARQSGTELCGCSLASRPSPPA